MSQQKNIINWGIIGCGNVTEIKSGPAFKNTEGFNLEAVMRRDAEKAEDYAKRHTVKKFHTDADELINDSDIDAIYIATPPDTHHYYALKVAKAGKPCCIEKPITPNYHEALEIYEVFNKANIPLFVAYYRRSLPRFLKIKEWLDDKLIGEVRHITAHLSKPASKVDVAKSYNWRTDANIATAGYFDDLASHSLDLFTFFLGNIKEAYGVSINQQNLYTANDAVSSCWLHENGITGSGTWNFGCNDHVDDVVIYGNKGTIEFSIFHENPVVLKSSLKNESIFIENPKHIQTPHVENMRDYLFDNSKVHPSTGATALHTSWVMDKILGKI
ncbi:Gfo/Idh/MocA family oxidoreductase [Sabulilitoribacter multivorans]|uniref:Gfo/Idh/MocA family oxidoreductase n=1 Tax=Flaviramulus multivorans TaxID=1304750 RepID=A0ABS9IJ89_9FLAO|nr:Gfo/Idh/MocA family oxidoreductase [Flaviramulus multivorans]MCF7560665.1 Gfo/Idh/MocA family oxidoreductase [Flaviramulus multivorans]